MGVPCHMYGGNAKVQTGKMWAELMRKYNIKCNITEPYTPQQIPSEGSVQEFKMGSQTLIDRTESDGKDRLRAMETDELPKVDCLEFVGRNFVHLYHRVSIKATVEEIIDNDKCKVIPGWSQHGCL